MLVDVAPQEMLFDEVVDDVMANMSDEWKKEFKSCSRAKVITYHHTLGRYIRDHYGLWQGDSPACRGKHPDAVSTNVMKKVWERLHA